MHMKLSIFKKIVFVLFSTGLISSCTEQYVFQNQNFNEALVVEATLTNEMKYQEVKLSRTISINDSLGSTEVGATVSIIDNNGTEFNFDEGESKYVSQNEFKAEPNKEYQLKIITASGKIYLSNKEKLTTESTIDLETSVIDKEGEKGVQINVKSSDPTNTSKFYRYEYEETYKIKTIFEIVKPNTSICYSTYYSKEIIQTNTNDRSTDQVNYPIRFIGRSDYKLTNRYTILVTQYVQNRAAYEYYSTLKKMSETGNLLSLNQPGFAIGNIKSVTNPPEKVVGFFDVASVSKKRIFFNHTDLFPTEQPANYFMNCKAILVSNTTNSFGYNILKTHVILGTDYKGTYVVEKECADCTTFASNIKPSFWID